MNPITTVMRQCRLFDGIPEEKYQNVLACLRGETKLFRKDAILLQIGECQKRPGVVMDGTLRIFLSWFRRSTRPRMVLKLVSMPPSQRALT